MVQANETLKPTPETITSKLSGSDLRRMKMAMRLSLGIGIFMFLMKGYAFLITGSAAILSDAAESVVHVIAVVFAAYSLHLGMKPPDESHPYGHDRISFFSAGFEGGMIVLAALYIIYEAVRRWLTGLSLENLGAGTLYISLATAINGGLGWYLVKQGKRYHSIVLEANGKHVLTDVWTSLGVVIALILTMMTGWLPFDPIIAIFVALNILWSGGRLIQRSVRGLMDESDPFADAKLHAILQRETTKYGIRYHHLRHRNAGNKLLIEFHLLFDDNVLLTQAHEQATKIEQEIYKALPVQAEVISHLEPKAGHDEVHERLLNKE